MGDTYKNDKGVYIKVTKDKNDKTHINIYDKDPKDPSHTSTHINIDKDSKKGNIVQKDDKEKIKTDISCFLTTACIRHYKDYFDDNCYELNTLRWFRDIFVSREDINYYYDVAPLIVEAIDSDENSELVYDYIYDNIIDYCVTEIEKGNYNLAYRRYKESVLSLEEYYIKTNLNHKLIRAL